MGIEKVESKIDESEVYKRPVYKAFIVDEQDTSLAEQAFGVLEDNLIHYSVTDISTLVNSGMINVNRVIQDNLKTIRLKSKNKPTRLKGIGYNYGLNKNGLAPAIALHLGPDRCSASLANLDIESQFIKLEANARAIDDLNFRRDMEQIISVSLEIEKKFANSGARRIAHPTLSNGDMDFTDNSSIIPNTSMRLARFSGVLLSNFFEQNQIPGIYVHQGIGKGYYCPYPGRHEQHKVDGFLNWTAPARRLDAFVNGLQLSHFLAQKKLPFTKEDINFIATQLNG